MHKRLKRYRLIACALGTILACGTAHAKPAPNDKYAQFYERAAEAFASRQYSVAIIELKNAVQANPAHAPSRALLGRAYLRSGLASDAEKELNMALHYGADEALVLPPLGNALLLQRKHEEILARLRYRDPATRPGADVLAIRGQAHLELGQLDLAERAFRDATLLAPAHAEPLLGLAHVLLRRGNETQARRLIDDAERLEPDSEEVWFRKAQVLAATGELQAAMDLLNRTLNRSPTHMRARMARARAQLQLNDFEAARKDAEFVLERVPEDAHAALLSAQASARLGAEQNATEAFKSAAARIASVDQEFLWRNPAALALAGKISFLQRDFEKTDSYLSRYLHLRPHASSSVRRLLGRARLANKDAKGAAEVLEPLVRQHPNDAEALVLLGEAYLRARNYEFATAMLERASALMESNAAVRTRLAMSRMGAGQSAAALSTLEEAFALDTGSLRAGLLLTMIQIRRGELQQALQTAQTLQSRFADTPVAENLLGVVHRNLGDRDTARSFFTRALELDERFEPAAFNLAELELGAGNTALAQTQYELILQNNPRAARALLGLADIAQSEGRELDANELLQQAINAAPNAIPPYIRLIGNFLEADRIEDALRTADTLARRHAENALAQLQLARAQVAARQYQPAIQTLRNATQFARAEAGPLLMQIGRLQLRVGDVEGAKWSFGKALGTAQKDAANTELVRLQMATADLDSALEMARTLTVRNADSANAHRLVGEVLTRMGRFDEAIAAYEKSLQLADDSEAIVKLFETLVTTGRKKEAFRRLENWIAERPGDLQAKRALGLGYIADGRLKRAEQIHDELLRALPNDPLVLNNLARMYQLRKDPRARQFARRVVKLAPTWPIGLDTLGWILVTEGEPDKGLQLLRVAHTRESVNPLIRYHMAAALSELNRNSEALTELDYILRSHPGLSWITEVKALRKKVAKRQG